MTVLQVMGFIIPTSIFLGLLNYIPNFQSLLFGSQFLLHRTLDVKGGKHHIDLCPNLVAGFPDNGPGAPRPQTRATVKREMAAWRMIPLRNRFVKLQPRPFGFA